jgi:hypothetical protein
LDAEEFLQETPDGGASLAGYFDNQELVKIRAWIGLSYGIQLIDYYFRHDSLIFAFVTERHFKVIKDSVDFEHTSLALEGRYYCSHNKIIARNVKGSGFWVKEQAANLMPDANSYYGLLQKKKKDASQGGGFNPGGPLENPGKRHLPGMLY